MYYLKKWKYFTQFASSIKNISRKNLQVVDVFSKIIKRKNIYLKEVKNFVIIPWYSYIKVLTEDGVWDKLLENIFNLFHKVQVLMIYE